MSNKIKLNCLKDAIEFVASRSKHKKSYPFDLIMRDVATLHDTYFYYNLLVESGMVSNAKLIPRIWEGNGMVYNQIKFKTEDDRTTAKAFLILVTDFSEDTLFLGTKKSTYEDENAIYFVKGMTIYMLGGTGFKDKDCFRLE